MTTTADTITDVDIVPPFEDMTKADMLTHLRRAHYAYIDNSETKEALTQRHGALHANAAENDIKLDHEHRAAPSLDTTVGPEDRARLEKAGLDRILTAGEKKTLTELVENDFATLRSQINATADHRWREAREGIEQKYSKLEEKCEEWRTKQEKLIAAYNAEAERVRARHTEKWDAYLASAEAAGFTVAPHEKGYGNSKLRPTTLVISGKDEELKAAQREHQEQRAALLLALETERLKTQRTITLASVPPAALTFLEQVPSAATVMADVAAQRKAATKAITAKGA